ncbi:ribonuclease H [Trifolium pratense]|uniref:Ribonuclease H n=1 Tax=Trifolium pratense TaxID=57577 RepID=A0A2K3PJN6_TRIPR|nr:ribonuclease H [Trifolium pratense]
MEKMRFPIKWRIWIRECISTPMISVLINGSPSKEFKMERGLCQGDPLSPFLFLLVAEGFNVLMNKAVEVRNFQGYCVGSDEDISISHLQFADDTLIIGKKCWSNILAMKAILQLFELISGLRVNFHKSELIGINVSLSWLQDAAKSLNCKVGSLPTKYLGLPIGGDPRKSQTWEPVISSVWKKLSSWKCHSAGGSVEPKKVHWVKWDRVCKPKEEGGLGIRNLKLFNIALLGKWWWRLKNEKDLLWCRVLLGRYGKDLGFVKNKSSLWWRDLNDIANFKSQGRDRWFEDHLTKVVGNGRKTLFWNEPWVEGDTLMLGVVRKEEEEDRWQWGGESYTVKNAYLYLTEGGCGKAKTENHLFFNCPIFAVTWRELVKWLEVPTVLPEGGYDHLVSFKSLICGKAKTKERLGVIWFSNVYCIWKVRNEMVFNHRGVDWEKVVEEAKVLSWRILRTRAKGSVESSVLGSQGRKKPRRTVFLYLDLILELSAVVEKGCVQSS